MTAVACPLQPGSAPPGRVVHIEAPGHPAREYFLYRPANHPVRRVLVLVHGISENACEQILRFAPQAEARHTLLVAPLFRRAVFGQYQQLVDPRSTIRADLALLDILEDTWARTGETSRKIDLFGFSGGGQFAHRFAMAHPAMVASCVSVAAGWYSFPDADRAYPEGLAGLPANPDGIDAAAVRCVPFHVIVGEHDTVRDASLRQRRGLDRRQGLTRLERARRWHEAMQTWGGETQSSLTLLPGTGHSFAKAVEHNDLPALVFRLLGA